MNDDPRVVRALQSSLLLGAVSTLIHAAWRGSPESRAGGVVVRAQRAWSSCPGSDQRQAIGIMLVTAAVANLALMMVSQTPTGWLWMVPPAIAASLGALWVLSANAAARN